MSFKIGDKVRMRNLFDFGIDTAEIHEVTFVWDSYDRLTSSMYSPMRPVQFVQTNLDPEGRYSDWFFLAT